MRLKPVLGPADVLFYSVGVIIGAGIYSVIGAAAGIAGNGLWLSFLLAAVVALLSGISYAEMATAFPAAGAEYVYLRHALPQQGWASFGVGFVLLVAGAATATTVALAFAGYLRVFLDVPEWLSAFALLAACTVVNIAGMKQSSWINVVFTSIEVAGLLIVIAIGVRADHFGEALAAEPHVGIVNAAAVLFFVYLGFEEIANLVEEVKKPERDIPRSIFLSLALTTVLYVLVALSVVALVPAAQLAGSEAPLATAVQSVSPRAAALLSAIALFATANTVLITLIASSRLAFSMGRDGELPAPLSRLTQRFGTPWVAALAAFALAAFLLPIGKVEVVAGLSSFAALLAFLAVNVALILLRYRAPAQRRPFRSPLSIGRMPVLPLLAIASIVLLLAFFERQIYLAGAVSIALGAIIYLSRALWRRTGR